jgi:hypothetical protein
MTLGSHDFQLVYITRWNQFLAHLMYMLLCPIRPHKKKLVYHPTHPKKVRREGGFYFYFFNFFLFSLHKVLLYNVGI